METIDPTFIGSLLEQLKQLTIALQSQDSFASKWLPSIVALVTTFVALAVGMLSYKASKEQIKTARESAIAQIKSSEEISKSQLINAKEITIAEIKANLVATSRKEWIENLRKNITELFSLANDMHLDHAAGEKSTDRSLRMWYLNTYIKLLLNPKEAEHNDFLLKQARFISFCSEGSEDIDKWAILKDEYLNAARTILKSEWNKVKELV